MKTVPALLALLVAACSTGALSEDEILRQAPVVNLAREGGATPRPLMEDAPARRALVAARDAFLREAWGECVRIARETLEQLPPTDVAEELRALRFEARRRLLAREVLSVRVLAERDVFTTGEEKGFRLVLANAASEPVEVPRSDGDASPTVFVADVTLRDWDVFGNVRVRTGRYLVPLPQDVVLAVGGRSDVPFSLPAEDLRERHLGFSELVVGGVLRPSVIRCGEERYYSAVDMREAVARVMPPGYEPIAADPAGTLSKAFDLGAREHLLLAAELTPPEERGAAVGRLVGFLRRGAAPAMEVALLAALRRLTGRGGAASAAEWIAWYEEGGGDEFD